MLGISAGDTSQKESFRLENYEEDKLNRQIIILATMMIVLGMLLIGCNKNDSSKALSVKGMKTDSAAYQGTVTIVGFVAMISQKDPNMFALMDVDEVNNNVPLPQRVFLQVRYEGSPRPTYGDKATITGSFKDGGQYFSATKIKLSK